MDWLWLAGLFEGEGCISFVGKNSVVLAVASTDRDVLERCQKIAGCGTITGPTLRPGVKPLWRWSVRKATDCSTILNNIGPVLCRRRKARANEALERLRKVRPAGQCRRGHSMSGPNLYVSPGGQKQCRTCNKLREAARKT